MNEIDYRLDKRKVRRSFDGAAARYDQVAVLQREVGQRLLERLDLIRQVPRSVLDLGSGTGMGTAALGKRYRKARLVALDIAPAMLRYARRRAPWFRRPGYICGDAEALPFAEKGFDLLFSNLTLQWCGNQDRAFREFLRVLRPGGMLMFTTFGPDTLKELRSSWAVVDGYTHVSLFFDMHDIGDALLRAGFAEPVMDVERFTLTYEDVFGVMRDLKQMGARNATQGRPRGLTGRSRLHTMVQAYEQERRDGRLPATYEVVYGHAWAPRQEQAPCLTRSEVPVPVTHLGRSRRGSSP